MDHIPLPRGASLDQDDLVPYVCHTPYDGGPFDSYPSRAEVLFEDFRPENRYKLRARLSHRCDLPAIPVGTLESFMQTWLFFGLLNEVLEDDFETAEYVTGARDLRPKDGHVRAPSVRLRITTKTLTRRLSQWVARGRNLSREALQRMLQHLEPTLHTVTYMVHLTGLSTYRGFRTAIRLSIITVAESIGNAMQLLGLSAFGTVSLNLILRDNGDMIATGRKMVQHGWCPRQIRPITSEDPDTTVAQRMFFKNLAKGDTRRPHTDCSRSACRLSGGEPFHQQHCQSCVKVGVDCDRLEAALMKGCVAAIRITERTKSQAEIEVVELQPGDTYYALSHVWAQELGNSAENSLPSCQLLCILERVKRLEGQMDDDELNEEQSDHFAIPCTIWGKNNVSRNSVNDDQLTDTDHLCSRPVRKANRTPSSREPLIWIDTLCCPTEAGNAKNHCFRNMRKIYNEARAVLVLDTDLTAFPSEGMTRAEMIARIVISAWATRIWCFQEASLACEVWFQFADRAIDFSRLCFGGENLRALLGKLIEVISDFLVFGRQFSVDVSAIKPRPRLETSAVYASQMLGYLQLALTQKAVTFPSDEPLCLAGLLDLDIGSLLEEEDSLRRMQRFWKMLGEQGGIPVQVIFLRTEKLPFPGFRWAPSSVIDMEGAAAEVLTNDTALHRYGLTTRGQLSPVGLSIHRPGFRFRMPRFCFALQLDPWPDLIVRLQPNRWLCLAFGLDQTSGQETRADIIRRVRKQQAAGSTLCCISQIEESFDNHAKSTKTNMIYRCRAVVGSEIQSGGSSISTVRIQGICHVCCFGPEQSRIWEICFAKAKELRKGTMGQSLRILEQMGDAAPSELRNKLLRDFRCFVYKLTQELTMIIPRSFPPNAIFDYLVRLSMGWYGRVKNGRILPSETSWTVD